MVKTLAIMSLTLASLQKISTNLHNKSDKPILPFIENETSCKPLDNSPIKVSPNRASDFE